jgi:hypothetical protein
MTAKMIAHMPGAGGNFLTRVFAQSHSPALIDSAQYPAEYHTGQRHPIRSNWLKFERQWNCQNYGYIYGHLVLPQHSPWLRVTVTTRTEWDWACANALWKNSAVESPYLTSDPDLPAEHHIPLRTLWTWDALAPALARIQTEPVNTHQRTLHDQWCGTHCPHPDSKRWQRICEHRWGHLRPEYCC